MGQRRQTTIFHKWQVWHEEGQDGRDQQNAGDVVLEVQKLVGTALTDKQVLFPVHTHRQWHTDGFFCLITDVQPVKNVAPRHACTWDHGQTPECWLWVDGERCVGIYNIYSDASFTVFNWWQQHKRNFFYVMPTDNVFVVHFKSSIMMYFWVRDTVTYTGKKLQR